MKISRKILIAVLTLSSAIIFSASAQVEQAQAGFRFLENPVSAEVMGRGGVGVTTTFNADAVFWNPALLGFVPDNVDLSLNRTQGIADINYNAVGASFRIPDVGVFGFSLLAMDYGTFYLTRRAANEQGYIETGTFTPTAISVGLAFSQRVSDRFSYGVHIKYARQNLGQAWVATAGDSLGDPNLESSLTLRKYIQDVFAIDVGAFYDFHYNGITFGAALYNVSRQLRYENTDFSLPFAVSFSATVKPLQFLFDDEVSKSITVSVESRHPRDFGEKAKFGAEYQFLDVFTARVGYMFNYDERSWTAGVGIKSKVSGIPFRLDYAIEPYQIFGNVHYITVGFSY